MPFIFKVPPPPSNAWKLQLANYDNVSFVATNAVTSYGMYVQPAGNVFYTTDDGANGIRQYNMSTSWDLSTSFANGFVSVSPQETVPYGVTFKPDGTKMYVIGAAKKQVFQYSLSTAWNIQTATYDSVSSPIFGFSNVPREAQFSTDGLKMFICDNSTNLAYQYSLTTPWNVGSAVYDNISYNIIQGNGMFFREDGKKLYSIGSGSDLIYQSSLATPWDLSTASYDGVSLNVHTIDAGPTSIAWKPDGLKFFIIGSGTETVYQFSIPI